METKRLIALDVLRGITIALMILVNTPGSWSYVYAPLRHAKWHGSTPTDFVFPFFLFIVGVSMWYSLKKYGRGFTKKGLLKVLKRFLVIFLLGLFLNAFPKFIFEKLRILGVLQRIAIAYGIAAILCLKFNFKQLVFLFFAILFGYWALLYFGGTGEVYSLASNFPRKIDLVVFGENHIYKGFGIPFDPEGLISSIPSVATVLLGYFSGKIITTSTNLQLTVKKLMIFGFIGVVVGKGWSFWFPINKALWTSTYVLYTGGFAMLFLAFLLWVIDVKGWKKWSKPFLHFGVNPLIIFMLSILYVKIIIYLIKIPVTSEKTVSGYGYLYQHIFVPAAGYLNGSLLFAITHVLLFWLLAYVLYRKKIFIKI